MAYFPFCLNCEDNLDTVACHTTIWRGKLGPFCTETCADLKQEEIRDEQNDNA